MQEGLGPRSAVCKDLSGQPCYVEQKVGSPENQGLISLAVLRTNDRTSVKGNTRRSGDRSGIRDVTAGLKQFGCSSSEERKIRGKESFGHWDREGKSWSFIHSPLIALIPFHSEPTRLKNTGEFTVSMELRGACTV